IRYSQLRRFSLRGAVNAVPLSCSAYNPCATRCGEFRPTGNAPSSASVSNEFPNPDWYSIATPGRAFLATDYTDEHGYSRSRVVPGALTCLTQPSPCFCLSVSIRGQKAVCLDVCLLQDAAL